jgi:hypothetical protein
MTYEAVAGVKRADVVFVNVGQLERLTNRGHHAKHLFKHRQKN